jgi:L-ascorbate metabolism protein UlaG (beta-lactamase superfamily)
VRITLIRNATVVVELAGRRILVDPMLDAIGARPPIENTANPIRNPTVALPVPAEDVVAGLDAVLVTHCHKDHLDDTAVGLLPRDVPVFCQPEDEQALRELRFDTRVVDDQVDWDGVRIRRVPAQHGFGGMAEVLGPVSGFVLDDLYLASDTVWCEGVRETIERFTPRVAVVNAAGASFLEGGPIVMGIDGVREVVARVPVVIAVHLEALNHCPVTRAELRTAIPSVLVPEDGETIHV